MSDLANLKTIRSNLISELATESANPKPSYNIDGQQVDWSGYRASLVAELREINSQIVDTEPYEIHSRGTT